MVIVDHSEERVRLRFAGWHWCSYVENTGRGWGLKDPRDEPYRDFTDPLADINRRAEAAYREET